VKTNLSWTAKFVRHKETRAPTLPYLLEFSVSPPFFAVFGQISYASVCFQGSRMKAIGFLDLVLQHRISHISEAAVATRGAGPPSYTCQKHLFSTVSFICFLVMNSYLYLLELLSFNFSEKRHIVWALIRQFRNLNLYFSESHPTYHTVEPLCRRFGWGRVNFSLSSCCVLDSVGGEC